jgi:RHS repeat-associated protein
MTVIDGLTNTWDFKDRLIQVEDTNMVARYTYDYTDRRVLKRVWSKTNASPSTLNSQLSTVLYPDKYFEVREADAPVKYVWNGNTRVARVTGSLTTSLRTQRLRVFPGFNMVSLAVTATNALSQLSTLNPQLITSAQRWNPATFAWVNVAPTDTLAAGTVLWLNLATNATLTVTGAYAEPANQTLQPGVNFVSGWGLQPLPLSSSLAPLSSTACWAYHNQSKTWRKRLTGELQTLSDVPAMLLPGDALFARPEVVSTLTVPESALAVRYYHQDHLGSSSVLTDATGALVSETANYAFGFARNEFLPRNLREPYGFTQKEREVESGLFYFESRFLSGATGRFVSVDQLAYSAPPSWFFVPQAHNIYCYSRNRPVCLIDPSGCDVMRPESIRDGSLSYGPAISFNSDPTGLGGFADVPSLKIDASGNRLDIAVGGVAPVDLSLGITQNADLAAASPATKWEFGAGFGPLSTAVEITASSSGQIRDISWKGLQMEILVPDASDPKQLNSTKVNLIQESRKLLNFSGDLNRPYGTSDSGGKSPQQIKSNTPESPPEVAPSRLQ